MIRQQKTQEVNSMKGGYGGGRLSERPEYKNPVVAMARPTRSHNGLSLNIAKM